jgi:hypothetical protein
MNVAEIAFRAAEVMSERGHCKYALEDETGAVCFVGAVYVAMYGKAESVLRWDDENILGRIMYAAEKIAGRGPVLYNNDLDVSGEDVILLLKETGKRLES